MTKSKIAIIANTSWFILNFKSGLILELQGLGNEVIIIAPKDDYSYQLEGMGCTFYDISINNKGTNPLEDAALIYKFYKLFLEIGPDILLLHTIKPNLYAAFAARVASIHVISTITGLGTVFLNERFSSKMARLLYRISLKSSKKVFFENPDDRQLFIDRKLVTPEKTDVIAGSGIDTRKYVPSISRTKGLLKQFLFIARLVRDKGIVEYVEAAKILKIKYPEVEFAILGAFYHGNPTAIEEKQMETWEAEGTVNYLGLSDDVQSIIDKTDCVVLPSYREGLSRVLLEAASMERPIVTTNVPGCKDVVNDGVNGFLCNVKDVDSLARQMEKILLLSEEDRNEMGRKSRVKVINEFEEQLVVDKYMFAIEEILDKNKKI